MWTACLVMFEIEKNKFLLNLSFYSGNGDIFVKTLDYLVKISTKNWLDCFATDETFYFITNITNPFSYFHLFGI